jgi:hypothetical protein
VKAHLSTSRRHPLEYSIRVPDRHNQTTGHDEGPAAPYGLTRRLIKLQLSDDLGNDEEEGDIDAKELTEIDLGGVQEQAVANKHDCSRDEPANLFRSSRMVQARLEAGIPLHLEVGGHDQYHKRSDWGRKNLAKLEHEKPHFIWQTLLSSKAFALPSKKPLLAADLQEV